MWRVVVVIVGQRRRRGRRCRRRVEVGRVVLERTCLKTVHHVVVVVRVGIHEIKAAVRGAAGYHHRGGVRVRRRWSRCGRAVGS